MARDIVIDARRGGGTDFLWGTVRITANIPRANGTAEVLWETTAKLVNGKYTLAGAQETDGTWHYRVYVFDSLSGAGYQWRVFLPAGVGPANLIDLPLAW